MEADVKQKAKLGKPHSVIAMFAFLCILISLPLPWESISGSSESEYATIQFSGIVHNGLDDEGIVGAILGLISLAFVLKRTRWAILPCAALCAYAIFVLADRNTGSLTGGSNTPGIGMYLFALSCFAMAFGVLHAWKSWRPVPGKDGPSLAEGGTGS